VRWRVVRQSKAWLDARFERRPFVAYVLPLLVWMGAIYILSAQPSLPQAPDPWWDLLLKKGAHMAAYAVLMVLWWRALALRCSLRLALGLAALLSVSYAVSDEVHQLYVPGRNGSAWDVGIDACGVLVAAGVLWAVHRTESR
jgi:VanZ family protein